MKRKILTFENTSGETEDLIPYVDGYGVEIGGTNLVDYLDQIESTFSKALLFLGAFASESALLTAYPNGSKLEVGTYAIVADTDTLYIYDTDNAEWLATASNVSGIYELNGLTPVSGALTITGGDINSTVSNAEVPTQTITAHLNNLYGENDDQNTEMTALYNESIGTISATNSDVESGTITYTASVSARDYNRKYFRIFLKHNSDASSTDVVDLLLTDGTHSKTYRLKHEVGSSMVNVTYKQLYAKLGFKFSSSPTAMCLIYLDSTNSVAAIFDYESMPTQRFKVFNIDGTYYWNTETSGYSYRIILDGTISTAPSIRASYIVSNVNKVVDSKLTTAIVDYQIIDDMLIIYSDEKFAGTVTVMYNYD